MVSEWRGCSNHDVKQCISALCTRTAERRVTWQVRDGRGKARTITGDYCSGDAYLIAQVRCKRADAMLLADEPIPEDDQ